MDSTHGYPIETVEYNGKTILIAQCHIGHEYAVPGVFEGWRWSANEITALKMGQHDVDSGGKDHEWRQTHVGRGLDGLPTLSAEHQHRIAQGLADPPDLHPETGTYRLTPLPQNVRHVI